MPQTRQARWGQERRLEFIDFRLYWDGRVNRADLTDFFGVSVPQASLDLAHYQELAPRNIVYDRTEKAYLATPEFVPVLAGRAAEGFLNQLRGVQLGIIQRNSTFLGWSPPIDVVRDPARAVEPGSLRTIIHSIRDKRSLKIEYQSMRSPQSSFRHISPHAVAFDGYRWHVRAYCHSSREFRDFVFARIFRMSPGEEAYVDPALDSVWNKEVTVILVPNPELPEVQRRVVELEFGMKNGRLELKTRESLLFYLLQHLGLLPKRGLTDPAGSPSLIFANRSEFAEFFRAHGLNDDGGEAGCYAVHERRTRRTP